MQGHTGRDQGQLGGRGSPGKCRQEPVLWFPQIGMGKAAWAGLELASLNHFSGALGQSGCPTVGHRDPG